MNANELKDILNDVINNQDFLSNEHDSYIYLLNRLKEKYPSITREIEYFKTWLENW